MLTAATTVKYDNPKLKSLPTNRRNVQRLDNRGIKQIATYNRLTSETCQVNESSPSHRQFKGILNEVARNTTHMFFTNKAVLNGHCHRLIELILHFSIRVHPHILVACLLWHRTVIALASRSLELGNYELGSSVHAVLLVRALNAINTSVHRF